MKVSTTWMIAGGVLLLGAGAAVYFLVIRKGSAASDKFGNLKLKATGKDKDISGGVSGGVQITKGNSGVAVVEPNWNNPFDMTYSDDVKKWVAPKNLIFLKDSFAKQYADKLYNAKGILMDDNDAVSNVFSKLLRDKVQISNVSRAFWTKYSRDLYDYLTSFLSESEMEKYVMAPVRDLPNYRTS